MALSIKDAETDRLVRQLAVTTGESMTDAVRQAVAERLERERRRRGKASLEELDAIARRCAALPRLSDASEDEILGYDENGIPTR